MQAIRRAVTRTTERQFGGHAQAQMQGSVLTGVAIRGVSDVDFYVSMDSTLAPVTRAGRVAFAARLRDALAAEGLRFADLHLGQQRIRGVGGAVIGGGSGSGRAPGGGSGSGLDVPNFDVIFAHYQPRPPARPPARYKLTPAERSAVRFLRLMPEEFTNLRRPQASALEEWVMVEAARTGLADTPPRLLRHLLERLSDGEPRGFVTALARAAKGRRSAGSDMPQWQFAAAKALAKMDRCGWPE